MSLHPADRPQDPSEPHDPSRKPGPPARRELPRYKVVLHAAAGTDMMFIVRTIMELTRLCRAEATHKMWETHHYGRSVLLVTYKERAELFAEQFCGRGLTVSIEGA